MAQTNHSDSLWPSTDYYQAIERLQKVIGQAVFIAEIHLGTINAGVSYSDKPLRLLAVIDFPEPNPYRQLYPHLIVLEDGRGINLGQVARISLERAFLPNANQLIYENRSLLDDHIYAPRRLNRTLLRETSKLLLTEILQEVPRQEISPAHRLQASATPQKLLKPTDNAIKKG